VDDEGMLSYIYFPFIKFKLNEKSFKRTQCFEDLKNKYNSLISFIQMGNYILKYL